MVERRDIKAVQQPDGSYGPDRTPLTVDDIDSHLLGQRTLGHYVVSDDSCCRLLAFDIDLTTTGHWVSLTDDPPHEPEPCNPRDVWRQQDHPGRPFLIF